MEALGLERIPPTTSVLASYEVHADRKGELLGFRRVRRYHRNQTEDQEVLRSHGGLS
jgi:hypothetical protein